MLPYLRAPSHGSKYRRTAVLMHTLSTLQAKPVPETTQHHLHTWDHMPGSLNKLVCINTPERDTRATHLQHAQDIPLARVCPLGMRARVMPGG